MDKTLTFKIKGMSQDASISVPDNTHSYENHNIRITARKDTTLLSVTNEKGTAKILQKNTTTPFELEGCYVGHCVINNYIAIFTSSNTVDRIYCIVYDEGFSLKYILQDDKTNDIDLNFDSEHPFDVLGWYESDILYKVYWTDNINQPRVLNLMADEWTVSLPTTKIKTLTAVQIDNMNFAPSVAIPSVTISRISSVSSGFPSGTIQYFITFFNKYGQETSIAYSSIVLNIAHDTRGASAEDTSIGANFAFTISDIPQQYDYLRIYSSIRTSQDGTPSCKIVADIAINATSISYIDTGLTGSVIDAQMLNFIGCTPVNIKTLTQKNNTLFIGNVKTILPNMTDEVESNTSYTSLIKSAFDSAGSIQTSLMTVDEYPVKSLYPYNNQLSKVSSIKGFKNKETYRFGIQLMHKTGKWCNPIFLQDYCVSGTFQDIDFSVESQQYQLQPRTVTINFGSNFVAIKDTLVEKGFIALRPVVVFPKQGEQNVICQGILCPTVFNAKDRMENAPYAQYSWFARPIPMYDGVETDMIYRHNDILPDNDELNAELQCNWHPRNSNNQVLVPTPAVCTDNIVSVIEESYQDAFYVDQNILTFHSPDIQFNEQLMNLDSSGIKMRIIGVVPITSETFDQNITTSSATNINYDFNAENDENESTSNESGSSVSNPLGFISLKESGITSRISGPRVHINAALWIDEASKIKKSDNAWKKATRYISSGSSYGLWSPQRFLYFSTYPWHRNGSLNNDNTARVDDNAYSPSAVLKHKIMCWAKVSAGNWYLSSPVDIPIKKVSVFNDDATSILKLPSFNANVMTDDIVYMGNIDKVVTSNHTGTCISTSARLKDGSISYFTDTFNYTGYPICRTALDTSANKNELQVRKPYPMQIPIKVNGVAEYDWYLQHDAQKSPSVLTGDSLFSQNDLQLLSPSSRFGTEPVSMRYKCSPHAVVVLGDSVVDTKQSILPQIIWKRSASATEYTYNYPTGTNGNDTLDFESDKSLFWNRNVTGYKSVSAIQLTGHCGGAGATAQLEHKMFFLAELYQTVNNKFGGNSQEAYEQNEWVPCGASIKLSDIDSAFSVLCNEGDTYMQRYDCLRTYPNSDEDTNSIIDMVSFVCETRVNIDGRYDKNRGTSNLEYISPQNFNLLNKAYTQKNNTFVYHADNANMKHPCLFPNVVAWSLVKSNGSVTDEWTRITLASTMELDGDKGNITALKKYQDSILCFQNKGIARILYDEKTQIATSAGVPVELASSGDVQGRQYISEITGCSNPKSICATERGIYFIDDLSKGIYFIGNQGIVNLSLNKGFDNWIKSQSLDNEWDGDNFNNFVVYADKVHNDVYFIGSTCCLVYSEILEEFVSFMDYDNTPLMFNISDGFLLLHKDNSGDSDNYNLWQMNAGKYNMFYGKYKDFSIKYAVSPDGFSDKTFNIIEYRSDIFAKEGTDYSKCIEDETFDFVRVNNEYQDTGEVPLMSIPGISRLKRKFRLWKIQIPRDRLNGRDRIRNPWCYVTLCKHSVNSIDSDFKFELHNMNIWYIE